MIGSVLVVGGGLAGFHVAHALRRQGFAGRLSVVGAEPHLPYDRPPLSKAFLSGGLQPADLALDNADDPLDATWLPATVAEQLIHEPGRVGVRTADGGELLADAVVLATGADAIRIGPPAPGAHVLRTLDDAVRLREDHPAGRHVVVVGTGFVGLEAASVAVGLGAASVTVVGPERLPLVDRLGEVVGTAVRDLHERHGVHFRPETPVTGLHLDADGRAIGVRVAEATIPADLVVVGIGARAATGWLRESALDLAPGGEVRCDATGRTGLPGVWALGDCARWADRTAGHWQDALDQAGIVATALVGGEPLTLPAPYFWSDQHGVRIQMAGHLHGDEVAVVLAGSSESADLLVGFERDGSQTAVLAMDRPRDVMRWRREHRTTVTAPQIQPQIQSQTDSQIDSQIESRGSAAR